MRRNKLQLFAHLVWATWDRTPWIVPEIEVPLYNFITQEVHKQGGVVLALNGMLDHTHLLTHFAPTISIADLVKQVKGSSSHFVNEALRPAVHFKWQGSYGAFTVSEVGLEACIRYIQRQKEHHARGTLLAPFEETYEEVT